MKVVVRTCALRCAMCHDDLDAAPVECPRCRTVTHAECAGPCPTLGCAPLRRESEPVAITVSAPGWWSRRLSCDQLGCLAGVILFCLGNVLTGVLAECGGGAARAERVRADMRALHDATDLFRSERGGWPVVIGDLGPRYLKESPPLDPWGTPYELRSRGGGGVLYVSAGQDGRFGTADDLASDALDPP